MIVYRWNDDTAIEAVWQATQVEPLRQDLIRDGVLVPVEPDYAAAVEAYERWRDRHGVPAEAVVQAVVGAALGEVTE